MRDKSMEWYDEAPGGAVLLATGKEDAPGTHMKEGSYVYQAAQSNIIWWSW
jgi:hypothetical protein